MLAGEQLCFNVDGLADIHYVFGRLASIRHHIYSLLICHITYRYTIEEYKRQLHDDVQQSEMSYLLSGCFE